MLGRRKKNLITVGLTNPRLEWTSDSCCDWFIWRQRLKAMSGLTCVFEPKLQLEREEQKVSEGSTHMGAYMRVCVCVYPVSPSSLCYGRSQLPPLGRRAPHNTLSPGLLPVAPQTASLHDASCRPNGGPGLLRAGPGTLSKNNNSDFLKKGPEEKLEGWTICQSSKIWLTWTMNHRDKHQHTEPQRANGPHVCVVAHHNVCMYFMEMIKWWR